MLGHADEAVKTVQRRALDPVIRIKNNLNREFVLGRVSDENGLA